MEMKKVSRREFIKGVATVTGVLILVACNPVKKSIVPEKSPSQGSDLPETQPQAGSESKILKVLVVYDSVYGNTEQIAKAMIEGIGGKYTVGISKAQEVSAADLAGIDLLIVGSPTHGGTFTETVKSFLSSIPANGLAGIKAAAFDTSFVTEEQGAFVRLLIKTLGYASPKIADQLTKKGAEVIKSEVFYVLDTEGPLKDGEVERASAWAADLLV